MKISLYVCIHINNTLKNFAFLILRILELFAQFAERYKDPTEKTQSNLKSQFPPEITYVPAKFSVPPKIKFLVHSHFEYILQKVFSMTKVKLTKGRLLLIGIYWYQSSNRRFIHSHLFIHSHKGGFIISYDQTTLMRMHKQLRK